MPSSSHIVKSAIEDTSLSTVGGDVYTIEINKDGNIHTYINGKEANF